jgi:Domain of unknown function (DUF4389)
MSAPEQPAGPPQPAATADVAVPEPAGPPSPTYPARFEIAYPAELNRWLPLVKWLLVIPHLFILLFLGIGAFFVAVYAFFAVLFTGRWPRGAFDYLVGTFRWAFRVVAYFHLMVDDYPPFTLADVPSYPLRLNIEYPEHIDNWRPVVQWLLAIPYLIVAGVLYWLTGILSIVAFFTILFTKRIPRDLFDLMVPGMRWQLRGNAYTYFTTDRYPPFVWG